MVGKKELYQVKVGKTPYGVALANDDKSAVITLWAAGKAVVVTLGEGAGQVTNTFDVGTLPYTAVIPKDSTIAAVSCFGSDQIVPIDLKGLRPLPGITVGTSPWGLADTPDGKRLVSANFYSGDMSWIVVGAIDPIGAASPLKEESRNKLMFQDPVGAGVQPVGRAKNAAFSADGKTLVMSDLAKNQIMVIDVATKSIKSLVPVGQAPYGVAFPP